MFEILKKKVNKKGFTLAELLVVVAIIGVLVAISIPIFTSQLTKARRATNQANARAAAAAAITEYLTNTDNKSGEYVVKDGKYEVKTGLSDQTATDYGSEQITKFVVIINDSDNSAKVTPQDNGTGADYNKYGS